MRRTIGTAVAVLAVMLAAAAVRAQGPGAGAPAGRTEAAAKALPRVVDVGKTWCVPCKAMVPVLKEAALRYKGNAAVEFIDLDKDPGAAERYKIQMIPTQIFFTADGHEFERHVGFLPFAEMEQVLARMGVKRSS